mmetsp:Transcript_6157/g.20086  ORF Transcript_6157/g.20086 Transcript_6157/m.20086 type:complete len:95 (-) Transcript_6157:103-387(-)
MNHNNPELTIHVEASGQPSSPERGRRKVSSNTASKHATSDIKAVALLSRDVYLSAEPTMVSFLVALPKGSVHEVSRRSPRALPSCRGVEHDVLG